MTHGILPPSGDEPPPYAVHPLQRRVATPPLPGNAGPRAVRGEQGLFSSRAERPPSWAALRQEQGAAAGASLGCFAGAAHALPRDTISLCATRGAGGGQRLAQELAGGFFRAAAALTGTPAPSAALTEALRARALAAMAQGDSALAAGLLRSLLAVAARRPGGVMATLFAVAPEQCPLRRALAVDDVACATLLLESAAQASGLLTRPYLQRPDWLGAIDAFLLRHGANVRRQLRNKNATAAVEALAPLLHVWRTASAVKLTQPLVASAKPGALTAYVWPHADDATLLVDAALAGGCLDAAALLLRFDPRAAAHFTRRRGLEVLALLQRDLVGAAGHALASFQLLRQLAADEASPDVRTAMALAPARLWLPAIGSFAGTVPVHARCSAWGEDGDLLLPLSGADAHGYAVNEAVCADGTWFVFAAAMGMTLADISVGHHDFSPMATNLRVWAVADGHGVGDGGAVPSAWIERFAAQDDNRTTPDEPSQALLHHVLQQPYAYWAGRMWQTPLDYPEVAILKAGLLADDDDATRIGANVAGAGDAGPEGDLPGPTLQFLRGLRAQTAPGSFTVEPAAAAAESLPASPASPASQASGLFSTEPPFGFPTGAPPALRALLLDSYCAARLPVDLLAWLWAGTEDGPL